MDKTAYVPFEGLRKRFIWEGFEITPSRDAWIVIPELVRKLPIRSDSRYIGWVTANGMVPLVVHSIPIIGMCYGCGPQVVVGRVGLWHEVPKVQKVEEAARRLNYIGPVIFDVDACSLGVPPEIPMLEEAMGSLEGWNEGQFKTGPLCMYVANVKTHHRKHVWALGDTTVYTAWGDTARAAARRILRSLDREAIRRCDLAEVASRIQDEFHSKCPALES